MKRRDDGITLLEVLLVLAIGGVLFVLSIQQYNSLRQDAYVQQLRLNIDILLHAAAGYYQANCPKGGKLDPALVTNPVVTLSIPSDLISGGYLTSNFPTPNPLVNSASSGNVYQGYTVQFKEYTYPRNQQVCSNPPTCTVSTAEQIGTIVAWQIQVTVSMQNTSQTQLATYQNYLAADCLTGGGSGGGSIAFCSDNVAGNYLAFDRLPSYVISNPNAVSTFWPSNPLLKQFNQMYTTNPITDLTGQSDSPEYQYYYCSS